MVHILQRVEVIKEQRRQVGSGLVVHLLNKVITMDNQLLSADQIARVALSGKRVVTAMVNTDSVYTTYPDGHYVMPPTLKKPSASN